MTTENLLDVQAPEEILKWFLSVVNNTRRDVLPPEAQEQLTRGNYSYFTLQKVMDLAWRAGDDCKELHEYCRKNKLDVPKAWFAEDILGEFGFRIIWGVQDHWVDFVVYAITATSEDVPMFRTASGRPYYTEDLTETKVYLKGSIKWDGCSDIHFGYHHWCGPGFAAKHVLLLQHLFTHAFVRMRRDAEDDGNHWQLNIQKIPSATDSDGFGDYQVPVVGKQLVGIDSITLRDVFAQAKNP